MPEEPPLPAQPDLKEAYKVDSYNFWARLAQELQFGNPLTEALLAAVGALETRQFQEIGEHVRADVVGGMPLVEALARHPDFFTKGTIGMIKSGEASGKLAEMASTIAKSLAAVAAHKKKRAELDAVREIELRARYEDRREKVEAWLRRLFDAVIRGGASHVHFEPLPRGARVLLRQTGLMTAFDTLPPDEYESVLFILRRMCNLFTMGPSYPQRGQFFTRVEGRQVDCLLTVSLAHYGESAMLRVFDRGAAVPDLAALGMEPAQIDILRGWAAGDAGILLFCGPGVSGRSTTMFSFLATLQGRQLKLCTVEHHLQALLPEVNHMRVKPEAGLDVVESITLQAEQDPHALLIDTTASPDVAAAVVRAAAGGPLVMTTVQAAGAPEGIVRFCELGVDPARVFDLVIGAVGQRLARRNCQRCVMPYSPSPVEQERLASLGWNPAAGGMAGAGCEHCDRTGFAGGMAYFELMPMSEAVADAVARRQGARHVRRAAAAQGMRALRDSGFARVQDGSLALTELFRTLSPTLLRPIS